MITTIFVHARPHIDELLAILLLRIFGEAKYPGVKTAEVKFFTTGSLPDGKTYLDFPEALFLGCGNSPFDEHGENRHDECCASLVAKDLNLLGNHPAIAKIVGKVLVQDQAGSKDGNAVSSVISKLHADKVAFGAILGWYYQVFMAELNVGGIDEVIGLDNGYALIADHTRPMQAEIWKTTGQNAVAHQTERFNAAKRALKEKDQSFMTVISCGKLKIARLLCDDEDMPSAAKYLGNNIVVKQDRRGNIQILTNTQPPIDLRKALLTIRYLEQKKRGHLIEERESELTKGGTLEAVPQWHGHETEKGIIAIYNGSLTAPDVEPTILTLDEVIEIIKGCLAGS